MEAHLNGNVFLEIDRILQGTWIIIFMLARSCLPPAVNRHVAISMTPNPSGDTDALPFHLRGRLHLNQHRLPKQPQKVHPAIRLCISAIKCSQVKISDATISMGFQILCICAAYGPQEADFCIFKHPAAVSN